MTRRLWMIFHPDGRPYFWTDYEPIERELSLWRSSKYIVKEARVTMNGAELELEIVK